MNVDPPLTAIRSEPGWTEGQKEMAALSDKLDRLLEVLDQRVQGMEKEMGLV